MIQFNLLPNVKLEYVKTQHTKHLLTMLSMVASLAGIAILLVAIVSVNIVQKKSLSDLDADIAKYSVELKSVKDLDKILTVQNQLSTLTSLHDNKPVASRLFTYMSQVTPAQASLNLLSVDFTTDVITMGGTAPSLDTVSVYTDTLKRTTYTTNITQDKTPAFTNVVLSAFGRSPTGATFTITASFNPAIFDTTQKVAFKVPQTAAADTSTLFEGGN